MTSQDLPAKDAPLTVNEQPFKTCTLKFPAKDNQVIVMSGHETIRVLEVEVDASLPASVPDVKSEGKAGEGVAQTAERPDAGSAQDSPAAPPDTGAAVQGEQQVVSVEAPAPAVQTLTPAVPISVSLPQPQAAMPITVQGCPQVLTQESLATLMTGMMAQTGSLGQPLLIPLSMAGSIGGQGGLAVLTLPTTNVATLPGLAAAANPAGSLLKLPFAGLQAATFLNSVQPQLQTSAQTVLQPVQAAAVQQVQTQPAQVGSTAAQTAGQIAGQVAATQATCVTTSASQTNIPLAALQTAGLSINPAIINAASLGAQPQFLSSLTSTPIISSAMSSMAGITSQIITNAQGQAALTNVTQSPVVIAPQPSVLKTATTLASAVPITCGDLAKVGQLVSKPQQPVSSEEGINLEEIREFAKNFKIRRLSLGLTQTQVGQALTATEGPAYSQSAICRFEKLDITPKSAQKLKPVLEKWLAEAEHWNQKGQQNLMEFVGGEPSKKRKRRTSFTPQAIEVLNSYFEKNALPTGQEITEIARELNYDREVVRVWFCNRRQTLKNTSKINVFQV
ncbi:POU domain, class 6, transcription factor 1 isoform X4 [Salarias fasciatus]|uniref:POU domain, class 6, transcription factor 1 isoform X4 n=1 Tax=Salarias fasciatus TaxID=181472 RepID=UPI0011768A55|nr:POU domain, class 6, transcription factor 1 isoform X4 [Salarias fasciatus]